MRYLLLLLMLPLLLACRQKAPVPDGNPPCIAQLIQQNDQQKTGFGFIAIYRYTYQKRYVYLGISDCCDQYNFLLDQACTVLCSPSGGFIGTGDGKCPDFFKEATDETLLWKRPQ